MIVAVAGGKGGVGKSTVAVNLARELEAVVVDADLSASDLPRCDGPGGPGLHEVLAGRIDPVDAVDRIGSIRILSCGRTLAGARASDLSELHRTVRRLEREYDRVVVDCPAGLARDVGIALQCSDVAVLVATPNRPALVDAFRTRTLALDLETPIAALVLNRSKDGTGERLVDQVEETFETRVTVLAERSSIEDARRVGRPVRDVRPNAKALDAFERVARTVERCTRRRLGSYCRTEVSETSIANSRPSPSETAAGERPIFK
ncbi:MinD/ParA family ATP-binding protein [Natrarchaeobius chitinivorans]|uniref:Chromosome partitioning protein ParA n=1 Tax=Natrarchaeobius chitinivorans TaxID=1679083 RepID=A0A3N6LVV4_NATCH|nr:MinD/ParA family protein [Natrarchaeobius chitinivorans]RQG94658.1 chromosome partitioning protein ParA [Natrarchaeobius chitinivorans]